jgi:Transposase IS116/IS110/IS902 family/CHC2 zinc finger
LRHARASIASLQGPLTEELIRDQIRQLRDGSARQKRLENLLVSAYRQLPNDNLLHSIPGLGEVTCAILTAFIIDIHRFQTPNQLVAYFGILPIEVASGVDRDGQARGPRRFVMSRRGNDLVRRYLWMAALSAIRHNPAVRALYARVVAKHPEHKAIAVGHAMRKLLHLVWAIWKTGRAFSKDYYPWHAPAHLDELATDNAMSPTEQAVGLMPDLPASSEVTTACQDSLPQLPAPSQTSAVDFAHLKRQLPIARVLDQLGLTTRLKGPGPQQRCACPIHRGDARGRTFSVHLDQGVFQCFDNSCAAKGDVIDLWASVRGMSLREAALGLVRTFDLEPVPTTRTGKRKG